MNTLVPGAPMPIQDGGSSAIRLERSRQPTMPVLQAQPLTTEAAIVQTLASVSKTTEAVGEAVKAGRVNPWIVAFLVALIVVAGGLWAAHMLTGDREIQDRLEALEDAEDARFVHDQWVVSALQALGESKPLPPYPVPQRRRKLDR